MKKKVLLVDDEYLALNLLEEYIKRLDDLEIVGKVKQALEALEILQNTEIDLLFLDIQMPLLKGNQLLKTLRNPPLTVFTTAYSDYAVEAFELQALDYLVKPFSFERFLQTIQKAQEHWNSQSKSLLGHSSLEGHFLSVKAEGKMHKIALSDLVLVEGLKEYVKMITKNHVYIVLESLKNLEAKLPESHFLRVHKSYIVAKQQVNSLDGNLLEVQGYHVPISRGQKERVVEILFG